MQCILQQICDHADTHCDNTNTAWKHNKVSIVVLHQPQPWEADRKQS